jgi:16S rRNA (cytosine967-C5)-methyltransferase
MKVNRLESGRTVSGRSQPNSSRFARRKPSGGRETALFVLHAVWEEGAYASLALGRVLRRAEGGGADRRLATELVYGAVKAKEVLDFLLRTLTGKPAERLEPVVREILHLGLYQIFYMDRIPPSAACNESVKLAKKFTHRGADRFVNAVLRNSIRQREALWQSVQADRALRLCHPRWLVDRWTRDFGPAEAEELCRWDNEPPVLTLRLNPLVTGRDVFLQNLREMGGAGTPSGWCPEGIILEKMPEGGLGALFQAFPSAFYIQDEGSMLPARVLAPEQGDTVLDLCAAPGGKTTHLATLMKNKGSVTACDIYEHKLALIRENADRLGLSIITTERNDGTRFRPEWEGRFDKVLADVPCSGLGVLRRRVEARWAKTEEDLSFFPPVQAAILDNAARYVKPGGYLVYSTCTIEAAENQERRTAFLASHPGWEAAPFVHPRTGKTVEELQLYPQRDGVDGFYVTRLHRK